MNKYALIVCMVVCIGAVAGCGKEPAPKDPPVARVNDFAITKDAFEEEFSASSYATIDTIESRKDFLSNLIDRKLILQDAQRAGIDRDPGFLKLIERFWEQSLLKLALDKKMQEIAATITVSDEEIRQTYDGMPQEESTRKTFEEMREQIKDQCLRLKKSQAVNAWLAELRKNADVAVNDALVQ